MREVLYVEAFGYDMVVSKLCYVNVGVGEGVLSEDEGINAGARTCRDLVSKHMLAATWRRRGSGASRRVCVRLSSLS